VAGPRFSIAAVVNDRDVADRLLGTSLCGLDEPTQELLLSNTDGELGTNLARLYNVLGRVAGPTVRAFVHSDVSFSHDLVERVMSAVLHLEKARKPWGALGIVGRSWDGGPFVWCHEIETPTPVCTLDSCFLVTRTDLPLRFDSDRFDEFHCFVEDYCLQCHDSGLGVWVIPAHVHHEAVTFTREGSRWGRYDRYRTRLDRKWRRRFPDFTTV
jgi:hypothetical protein